MNINFNFLYINSNFNSLVVCTVNMANVIYASINYN